MQFYCIMVLFSVFSLIRIFALDSSPQLWSAIAPTSCWSTKLSFIQVKVHASPLTMNIQCGCMYWKLQVNMEGPWFREQLVAHILICWCKTLYINPPTYLIPLSKFQCMDFIFYKKPCTCMRVSYIIQIFHSTCIVKIWNFCMACSSSTDCLQVHEQNMLQAVCLQMHDWTNPPFSYAQ